MSPLDEPVKVSLVRLSRIPSGWVIRDKKHNNSTDVSLTIDTGKWGMFRVLAVRTVYGSVDTSPEQFATKEIIQEIKAICRRPVKDCPEAFYAYFLERYPSEKSLVTAYSQLQPGPQLADRTFVDRTEHAALVLASLCEMDFNKSIPSRLPHESWDVYVGGASRWVSAYIFEKNGIEGVVLQVKPGEKQDKNLPKEEIARRLALVSAAMIDGLVAEAK